MKKYLVIKGPVVVHAYTRKIDAIEGARRESADYVAQARPVTAFEEANGQGTSSGYKATKIVWRR